MQNKPSLGFYEWLDAMKSHSCPNCEHWGMMKDLRSTRIPVVCVECYAGYSQYMHERGLNEN